MDAFWVEVFDGIRKARMGGELDLAAYEDAARELAPFFETPGDVTIELEELTFVDSSGIRLFIQLQQALRGSGALTLRSPQPHVARILEIAGLADLGVRIQDDPR